MRLRIIEKQKMFIIALLSRMCGGRAMMDRHSICLYPCMKTRWWQKSVIKIQTAYNENTFVCDFAYGDFHNSLNFHSHGCITFFFSMRLFSSLAIPSDRYFQWSYTCRKCESKSAFDKLILFIVCVERHIFMDKRCQITYSWYQIRLRIQIVVK